MGTGPQAPAGWYPDPERPGTQRYWDGSTWTEQTQTSPPRQPQPPSQSKDPKNDGLALAGWITAVLIPFIGAIIGVVLMNRKDVRGGRILILAGVIFVLGIILIAASGDQGSY
jgi:hypothetical protein